MGVCNETKADEVDEIIRKSNLGKIWDDDYGIIYVFDSKNEEKLLQLTPSNADVECYIRDFNYYIEDVIGYIGDFYFNQIVIETDDIIEFVFDNYNNINIENRLMNSKKPIHEEFNNIIHEVVNIMVKEQLKEIEQKLNKLMLNKQ